MRLYSLHLALQTRMRECRSRFRLDTATVKDIAEAAEIGITRRTMVPMLRGMWCGNAADMVARIATTIIALDLGMGTTIIAILMEVMEVAVAKVLVMAAAEGVTNSL